MNYLSSTAEGVALEAPQPLPEFVVALDVVALSQSQPVNMVWIDARVIEFIINVVVFRAIVGRVVIRAIVVVVVVIAIIRVVARNLKIGSTGFGSGCYGCDDMGGTNVDYMCIAADTVVQSVKFNRCRCLTLGKSKLQLLHCDCVVLGVIERDVANLGRS